jgi:hypothetical protein
MNKYDINELKTYCIGMDVFYVLKYGQERRSMKISDVRGTMIYEKIIGGGFIYISEIDCIPEWDAIKATKLARLIL